MTALKESDARAAAQLSVVIIARNEARNIARAIESVLRAVENWPQTEILLVDSASTDETVEIARRYPINIVRLPSSWFLSVAAGRYIGMVYTRGEMVLHLDGDMELNPEWVDRSMAYALDHPEAAAIGGYWRNVYMKDGQAVGEEDQRRDRRGRVLEEKFINGVILCRRSAVQQVGGFQPFIRGEEDIELCLSLRQAGYKIVRLPCLTSRHYCISEESLAGNLRRIRLGLWLGYGQVPRYHWGTGLFWDYIKLRITIAIFLIGGLIALIGLLLVLLSRNVLYLGGWLIILSGFILAYSIRKHGLRRALMALLSHALIAYSAVRGFMMVPRSPAEYPTDAEIVQVHEPIQTVSTSHLNIVRDKKGL